MYFFAYFIKMTENVKSLGWLKTYNESLTATSIKWLYLAFCTGRLNWLNEN